MNFLGPSSKARTKVMLETGIYISDVDAVLRCAMRILAEEVGKLEGEKDFVRVPGFGTFRLRKAPNTDDPKMRTIRFRPSKQFRQAVNPHRDYSNLYPKKEETND